MLPQLFRPTVSSFLAETIGRVNLEYPASGLTSVAYWLHFSRWCRLHPIPRLANGKYGRGRGWLWESVLQKEGLDSLPVQSLEFGVYLRGEPRIGIKAPKQPFPRLVVLYLRLDFQGESKSVI